VSALESFIKKAAEERGLRHVEAIYALRAYIKAHTIEELTDAIRRIKDPFYLRTLWEAGLPAPLQRVVLEQLEHLTSRHGPQSEKGKT